MSEPKRGSVARQVFKSLLYAALAAAWIGICFVQVGLVGSRLFSGDSGTWQPGNQIAGMVLVYLPVSLAAAAVWLSWKKPLSRVLVLHILAMVLSLILWVA